jgi:hypothetical protein
MAAALIVKHQVADFAKWKAVFDSFDDTRREHGWISAIVYRDAVNPNMVTIVNRVKDLEGAKRYGSSEALRNAMQNAGVLGPPEISFLSEVEDRAH